MKLSTSEAKKALQIFIDALPDGVMILNNDGVIELVNGAQELLIGIDREQLLGLTIFELVHQGIYSDPMVDLVLKRKKPVTLMQNTPLQTCLMVTATPIFDHKTKITSVVIYSKDVTSLYQLQQQLEQTQLLTQRYSLELNELRAQSLKNIDIVANSKEMKKIMELALRISQVDSTVLILGESGVGKEIMAKTIHDHSSRNLGPFIKVNCSAIPDSLIESELFGYEPGTFTGGKKEGKAGLFELADNGDFFLDEIGDLPLSIQPKLLRVLQEMEVVRLGGSRSRKINVRIIAATNKDLKEMVKQNLFREDLFFRLNVIPITIPPLRERKDDIIPLIYFFKEKLSNKYKIKKDISKEVINALLSYEWPGNVRELQNVIERLLIISPNNEVRMEDLPTDLLPPDICSKPRITVNGLIPIKQAVLELEKQLIEQGMALYGSTAKVANVLGVHQSTIIRKLYKINKYSALSPKLNKLN